MAKVRLTGTSKQVQALAETLEEYSGLKIKYKSREYKQTRYNKNSKEVSVYLDIEDFEE